MTTYVAFLRAINVGGHAVVRMTDLRDAFSAAGCANVRTFIASGNVVFEAPPASVTALFGRIRERVTRLLSQHGKRAGGDERPEPDAGVRLAAGLRRVSASAQREELVGAA